MQSQALPGLPITQYVYDAEGARIAKGTLSAAPSNSTSLCAPPLSAGFTLTARYLVDQGGDQVTEMSEQGGEVWKHSNVFSAARLTATYDTSGLHFELADPLGTKRIQANVLGQVDESCASLPFGDALSCTPNPFNIPNLTTADDATEHHFTQKERDAESNNDYFFARYYNSAIGRFITPDWSAKVEPVPYAQMGDPQSLNLYAYVRNNPLIHVDADGHEDPNQKIAQIVRQAKAAATQQPCEAEMRARPGDITSVGGYGASHAWWHVVDSTGQDYTLSFTLGLTTKSVPVTVEVPTDFVTVPITANVPAPFPVLNSSVKAGPQSATNANDNQQHGVQIFDQRGPAVCGGVSRMLEAAKNFPQNTVPYGPQEGAATSNSGARYLGAVGGFNPPRPSMGHSNAVGWDNRIPGVEK